MTQCGHLFHAENVHAYFVEARKQLVISADATLSPADEVHICPNPIAPRLPLAHEYIVEGTTKPGIHSNLVMKRTVYGTFAMDAAPKSVVVFVQGIDNPARIEVQVIVGLPRDTPASSVAAPAPAAAAGAKTASDMKKVYEATGWSRDFKYDEAFADALAQLQKQIPPGFHNPDVGLTADVIASGAEVGGNIALHGVFVTLRAR